MKKIFWLVAAVLSLFIWLAAKNWVVSVARADIRQKPDFLSKPVAQLKKGTRVESTEELNSGWLHVRLQGGGSGYVHRTALQGGSGGSSILKGLSPGKKEASHEEVAMAAKGFNEEVEKKVKGSRGYNFRDLDWVLAQPMSLDQLGRFIHEGKLE